MVDSSRLRQWLEKYQNPEAVFRDIISVVNSYKGLQPQKEAYTFVDGTTMDLVNLSGTIPVTYKSSTYNIPICIWLIDTHPRNAPICYVRPTPDMSVKVSMFVDQNGKIYLPYLHDWVPNRSDLIGLIQVMVVTFGEHPPVFARSKSNPVYPPSSGGFGVPPYPTSNIPYPAVSGFGGPGFGGYPPYPINSGNAFPSFPPYPGSKPALPEDLPIQPGTGTIKDEHIRESLITAIEEKLVRRMKDQFMQTQAEISTLKKTQDELKQGKVKLDALLAKLEKEQKDLEKNVTVLKDKEAELNSAIERIGNQESIDVDDAVTTTAPLFKQLLNCFAEEAAHEDTIYYMGEALRCGVIDLEVFLKQIRILSRKQFVLRALMQKCRQKAGLPV